MTHSSDLGRVDNSVLFSESEDGSETLKPRLQEHHDYILITEYGWKIIVDRFGGGPEVKRQVIALGGAVQQEVVEIYPLTLTFMRGTQQVRASFSKCDTVRTMQQRANELLKIAPNEHVQYWNYLGGTRQEQLDQPDRTLYEAQLEDEQQILIDTAEQLSRDLNQGSDSSLRPVTRRGCVGLTNMGNTCFMNSALQCLSHVTALREYFLTGQYRADVNTRNPLGVGGKLAHEYSALMAQLWHDASPVSAVLPRSVKWTVQEHAPQFRGYNQHDAQELLAYLLDALHEDVNRVRDKPYLEVADLLYRAGQLPSRPTLSLRAREAWMRHVMRNNSALVEQFQGLFSSTVTCPACSTVSITFDPFMYLSLPLPRTRTAHLVTRVIICSDTGVSLTRVTFRNLTAQSMKVIDLKQRVISTLTLEHVTSSQLTVTRVNPRTQMITRVLADEDPITRLLNIEDDIYIYHVTPVNLTPVSHAPAMDMAGMSVGLTPLVEATAQQGNYLLRSVPDDTLTPVNNVTVSIVYRVLKPFKYQSLSLFSAESRAPADWQWEYRPVLFPVLVVLPRAKYSYVQLVKICELKLRAVLAIPSTTQLNLAVALVDMNTGHTTDLSRDWHSSRAVQLTSEVYLAVDLDLRLYNNKVFAVKPFVDVAVGEENKSRASLYDCLNLFTSEEQLSSDNLWRCPTCKDFKPASKKMELWQAPPVLVVHLKRFAFSGMYRSKLDDVIEFPLRNLDLSGYVQDHTALQLSADSAERVVAPSYDLFAVANHYGGMGGGHYTAMAYHSEQQQWYHYDDASVQPIAVEDVAQTVVSPAAYILFYKRREV
jgi:ubiquitin carboxyl-terminal hydrolase 4/11/15